MTLRSTNRQELSASRTHRTPLFLPCTLWPRWKRKPDRSASSRTQPSLSSGEGRMPPPSSPSPDEAVAHLRGDGTRRAPPPAPCGAAGCQPDPAPRTQPRRLRRQVGARSRPGDAGPTRESGMPGSRGARSGAGPRPREGGGSRRRAPFPLLLTAAGQRQEPARLGREAACRRRRSARPAPLRAPWPGPPRGAALTRAAGRRQGRREPRALWRLQPRILFIARRLDFIHETGTAYKGAAAAAAPAASARPGPPRLASLRLPAAQPAPAASGGSPG